MLYLANGAQIEGFSRAASYTMPMAKNKKRKDGGLDGAGLWADASFLDSNNHEVGGDPV